MGTQFNLISSRADLLDKAKKIAVAYAQRQINPRTVGIAFLGAVARGYFDEASDIDISIFETGYEKQYETNTLTIDGLPVHYFRVDYDMEKDSRWEMGKRWAYSNAVLYYDPQDELKQLIEDKVRLGDEERRRLLMAGITLSEWYVNRLTELWIRRGSVSSAHYMINEGLDYFFSALFALNRELMADYKWRLYCAAGLKILPARFTEKLAAVMQAGAITVAELERRKRTFMEMWREILPLIEAELGMKYADFKDLV